MPSCMYEKILHNRKCPVNVFMASLNHSCFHLHYDYELILVLKGSIIVNTDKEHMVLHKGNILLLNSKVVHEIVRTDEANLCLFVQLAQSLITDTDHTDRRHYFYLNNAGEYAKHIPPKNGFKNYIQLSAKIGIVAQKNPVNSRRLNAYVWTLVADFFDYLTYDIRQENAGTSSDDELELLVQMVDYVQAHYQVENPLDDLGRKFGIGEKTLYRFFKKNLGMSPKMLLLHNQIIASKDMLRVTDKPIPCIAAECGFHAENTFYRVFKKNVGVTPNEYRSSSIEDETGSNDHRSIRGYLSFNKSEGIRLLEEMANEEETYEV